MSSQELEAALMDCAAGRERGLGLILEAEGPRMLGLARRLLRRNDLAEEALQDAMVQIWQKADQFRRDTGSARGWIYAVLRHRCLNILRDGRRLNILSHEELTSLQEDRQDILPDEDWRPLAGTTRLADCLEHLDAGTREAILLAHVAGFSHGEIAARRGMPLGTVKSWIRRGLASLRDCMS